MNTKVQLIFCRNSKGRFAFEELVQNQPPIGILTIASNINNRLPNIKIGVLDGRYYSDNELLNNIDGEIIGFSVWYSNYGNTLSIAKEIKNRRPNTIVVFGGPHVTALGRNVLLNNHFIDYVVIGEGEIPFYQFLIGVNPNLINGLYSQPLIKELNIIQLSNIIDLDTLPIIDLELLKPKYSWFSSRSSPSMSAFPLAGIRGCNRHKNRCEYCSIPFNGYRYVSAVKYWGQIQYLKDNYDIDFFFETGDTFSKNLLNDLVQIKPVDNVGFRVYGYPGLFNIDDIYKLKFIGVRTVYMGIESVLHWKNKNKRSYSKNYSIENLIEEFVSFQNFGIDIIPGFLLGLPGEDENSLRNNIELINILRSLENVKEISINIVLPLPGTDYFNWSINNNNIAKKYFTLTNRQLIDDDLINNELLCKLFVENFTSVNYDHLLEVINSFKTTIGSGMTNWNSNRNSYQQFLNP